MKKKVISHQLVQQVLDWLGYDGIAFFQMCLEEYGTIHACWITKLADHRYDIPHSVHFQEGMSVRNFIRGTGLCENWDSHDFDNNWADVIQNVLDFCEKMNTKKV